MANYVQRYEWAAWKGTPDDLERLAAVAAADLQLWSSGTPAFGATLALAGGREISLDDMSELRTVVDRSTTNLIELSIRLHVTDGSVEARFRSEAFVGGAVALSVNGTDESRVHGLALRLREGIDAGRRREPVSRGALSLIALLAAAGLISSVVAGQGFDPSVLYAVQITGIVVVVAVLAYEGLVPSLELLRVGERSRLQRWGTWVGGAITAVSLLLGVVALIPS